MMPGHFVWNLIIALIWSIMFYAKYMLFLHQINLKGKKDENDWNKE